MIDPLNHQDVALSRDLQTEMLSKLLSGIYCDTRLGILSGIMFGIYLESILTFSLTSAGP